MLNKQNEKQSKIKKVLNPKIYVPAVLIIIMFIKLVVWDNANNRWIIKDIYYKPPAGYKGTIASPISLVQTDNHQYTMIDDASKRIEVQASDYIKVSSKEEIINSVQKANKEKKKISMSGARHSMNGQNLGDQIHLDMQGYDQILEFNQNENTLTVESGVTWKQIQEYIGQRGKAVRVMQDSNIFTVGGSMGSNIHGKDIRYGQLIESINWFGLVMSNGVEERIDRLSNPDLFSAVIGGFGGFGVITEVNIKLETNTNYRYTISHHPAQQVVQKWDEYIELGAEQVEAHFSISKNNLLEDAQIYYYVPTDIISNDDVSGENSIWLRKAVYRISRTGDLGKRFRWWMQKYIGPIVDPGLVTRNGAMAAPFRTLELDDPKTTDILQEYFVPRNKVNEFLPKYRHLLKENNINLINCVLRRVQTDKEALVNYSQQEMYGFVCYYKVDRVDKNSQKNSDLRVFTGQMIDYLNEIEGKYYLAYNIEGHTEKIQSMYPELDKLFEIKNKYDPSDIFGNKFFEQFEI